MTLARDGSRYLLARPSRPQFTATIPHAIAPNAPPRNATPSGTNNAGQPSMASWENGIPMRAPIVGTNATISEALAQSLIQASRSAAVGPTVQASAVVDYARVADALLGPVVKRVPGFLLKWALPRKLGRKPLIRAYMEYGLWASGYGDMTLHDWLTSAEAQADWARFTTTDTMHTITCPTLSLVGAGEGEEMLVQTREFHDAIASRDKELHVVTLECDGTHDHCMLDDHSRMQQVIVEWLGGVFGHDVTPARSNSQRSRPERAATPNGRASDLPA